MKQKTLIFTIILLGSGFCGIILAQEPPTLNIPPTNAFDRIHSDNGTITATNFSMPLNIKGSGSISVQSNNSTHTVIVSSTSGTGTYNETLANNTVINSGGYQIVYKNGTGATVKVQNSNSGKQVNVTISATGTISGVSSVNGLSGPAINIKRGNTYTTITNSSNTITITPGIATDNVVDIYDTTIGDYTQPSGTSVASSSANATTKILNFQANTGAGWNGNVFVEEFTGLTVGEKFNEVCLKINTAAGNVRVKVYQDDGTAGAPSTLLAESASVVASGATGTIQCITLSSNPTVPASGNLWAGFETSSASLSLFFTTSGCVGCRDNVAHVFGAGPNPFGSVTTANNPFYVEIRNELFTANLINDGNTATEWVSSSETHPNIYVNTGSLQTLSAFAIYPDKSLTTCTQIKLSTSTDTINWNDKRTINISDLTNGAWNFARWNMDTTTEQYVRTYCNDGSAKVLAIWEVKVLIPSSTQLVMRHGHESISGTDASLPLNQ